MINQFFKKAKGTFIYIANTSCLQVGPGSDYGLIRSRQGADKDDSITMSALCQDVKKREEVLIGLYCLSIGQYEHKNYLRYYYWYCEGWWLLCNFLCMVLSALCLWVTGGGGEKGGKLQSCTSSMVYTRYIQDKHADGVTQETKIKSGGTAQ